MVVFRTNLRRLFKKKVNLLFMFLLPLIFTMVIMGSSLSGDTYKIGFVDGDSTKYTEILKTKLGEKGELVTLQKDEIQDKLLNGRFDYVVEIEKGATAGLIAGQEVSLKGYSVKESNASVPLKLYLESFVNASKNIGRAANGDESKFYDGIKYYQDGTFATAEKSFANAPSNVDKTLRSLGFLVMSMVFLISFSTMTVLEDKTNGTYFRMMTTPLSMKSYMLQNILSFVTLSVIQIAVVFTVMNKAFGLDFGPSMFNVFLVFVLFAIVCVALGVLISRISKNMRMANTIISLINIPMCMLGGCFWPRDIMPDTLQAISNAVPTTWVLEGAAKVVNGGALSSIGLELSMLAGFFLLFFVISSVRKADIAR